MLAEIVVDLYFSTAFPESHTYAMQVREVLAGLGQKVLCHDLARNERVEEWNRLGLLSVPSIVFSSFGRVFSTIVRYASPEEIVARLKDVRAGAYDDGDSDSIPVLQHPEAEILEYIVEDSSGVHRYARWNEEYLRTTDQRNGWCAPSRVKADQSEFVVLRLSGRSLVRQVRMYPRIRNDGLASFRSFPRRISIWGSDGGTERQLWSADSIRLEAPGVLTATFGSGVECDRLRVVVEEAYRTDGYAYPCIACLEVLGRKSNAIRPGILRVMPARLDRFDEDAFQKAGLFASDGTNIELFNLLAGQRLPASQSNGQRIVIVRVGRIRIENGVHTLEGGDVAVINSGAPFEATGLDAKNSFLVVFDPRHSVIWEARRKTAIRHEPSA